jgi:ankyrin repeat protein
MCAKPLSALVSLAGETPLTFAIANQDVDLVRYFLDQGADLHKVNASGSPPLHLASGEKGTSIDLYIAHTHLPYVFCFYIYTE